MSGSKLYESSTVRISHSLNESEKAFIAERRETTVLQCLKRHNIDCNPEEIPNIALIGSGGGERAMLGLLGSVVQLNNTDLLDCMLYLSGVSGSTWCMASLYHEQDWSTKAGTVTDDIIQRLKTSGVSWKDTCVELFKYLNKKNISLTDFWSALVVTSFVKQIDETTLSQYRGQHTKDPYPIYTVIDKKCSQCHDEEDLWFELTQHEAGYTITGAFVDVSSFGSQFNNGEEICPQPEIDVLFLQGLCSSALADFSENMHYLWEKIKELLTWSSCNEEIPEGNRAKIQATVICKLDRQPKEMTVGKYRRSSAFSSNDEKSPDMDKALQILLDLADMNLCVLKGEDPSAFVKAINEKLTEPVEYHWPHQAKNRNLLDKKAANEHMMEHNANVCNALRKMPLRKSSLPATIIDCLIHWIWGKTYNFLCNITDSEVPPCLAKSEVRYCEDAGLCLNSPYLSVLRKERDIDLIISLDFSEGDPFLTVTDTAKICRDLKIPFPKVQISPDDYKAPKDFYVFEDKNGKAPTVIHIPLFNKVNCGDKIGEWREKYKTDQGPYEPNMIDPLLEKAGENISNNKNKLVEKIKKVIKKKAEARQN